ncbi:hypothetical protein Scep_027806 [Stephania cephalantha]|uniref:Uncharacterized protein n=1 Tax=Stephania cephalantha TaxID=152367 RepID=A0AAP0HIV6_9MAGN
MVAVDRSEAPMDVNGADGMKASSANNSSRCSGGPARRPTRRGARERADEQQPLGTVSRSRDLGVETSIEGHVRSSTDIDGTEDVVASGTDGGSRYNGESRAREHAGELTDVLAKAAEARRLMTSGVGKRKRQSWQKLRFFGLKSEL